MPAELAPLAASSKELHKVPIDTGKAYIMPKTDLQNSSKDLNLIDSQQQQRHAYKKHSDVNAAGFNKRQGSFSRMKNIVQSEQNTTDVRRSIQNPDKVKMNKKLQLQNTQVMEVNHGELEKQVQNFMTRGTKKRASIQEYYENAKGKAMIAVERPKSSIAEMIANSNKI